MTQKNRPGIVTLVTRTATSNQGNEALSAAWKRIAAAAFPDDRVHVVERVPAFLRPYRVDRLAARGDLIAEFDRVARALIERAGGGDEAAVPDQAIRYVTVTTAAPRPLAPITRRLPIRRVLTRLGMGRKAFADRLALYRASRLVIVNPAGEFHRTAIDTALPYFLDIRCAQLLGVPTAIVNFSWEAADPRIGAIAEHVFGHAEMIEVRDAESRRRIRELANIEAALAPDAVITTPFGGAAGAGGIASGKMGFVMNAHFYARDRIREDMGRTVADIRAEGLEPVLLSNEWETDGPHVAPVAEELGIEMRGQELGYAGYMDALQDLELIASSRLHSCVLALASGVPAIPLEVGTFKLSGFFDEIGMGDAWVDLTKDDWRTRLIERVRAIRADRAGTVARQEEKRKAAIAAVERTVLPRLREAAREG